jgi:hypothetical protein
MENRVILGIFTTTLALALAGCTAWDRGEDMGDGVGGSADEGDGGGPGGGNDGGDDGGDDGDDGDDDPTGGPDRPPGDPDDPDNEGCYMPGNNVGLNSQLEWPNGTVARDQAFTLAWNSTQEVLCGNGVSTKWSTKNGPFLGDVDGDGNLDMGADIRKGGVVVLPGNGDGTFGSFAKLANCTSGGQVDFGDVDNDGDLDLLDGSHSGFGHVYLNNGGVNLAEIASGPLMDGGVTGLQGAALGDFNGDGNLDAVLGADQFAAGSWIFFGDGNGGFAHASIAGLGNPVNFSNIVVGDFDNDDDIDIFGFIDYDFQGLGGSPSGPALFLNDGSGTQWTIGAQLADPFPGGAGQPEGAAVGDIDCDGNLDAVLAGKVYLGNGAGGLQASATLASHTFGPFMNLGDMDGDGNLDVVMADSQVGVRVFYGDGSGATFEEVDAGLPAEVQTWLDVGDLDNNGNLDILIFAYTNRPEVQAWTR